MNYEDVDFLFRENYAVSPALIDIPPEGLFDTMRAIRELTGITLGRDLGAVLRNCPELWIFDFIFNGLDIFENSSEKNDT